MNQQRSEPAPSPSARPRRIDLASWLLREVRRRQRPGQAMTEFTLVVPILLLVIYAMIIFALAIHTQIDFGNAISSGIREATVLGNGGSLPAGQTGQDIDATVGQMMLQNLRSDDKDSVTQFSIQLEQARPANVPDADATTGIPGNTYRNTYLYDKPSKSFRLTALFLNQKYDGATVTACQYYYQAHVREVWTPRVIPPGHYTTDITYLDQAETIILKVASQGIADPQIDDLLPTGTVLPIPPNLRYPNNPIADLTFLNGCGRTYYNDRDSPSNPPAGQPTSYSASWDCTYAWIGTSFAGGGASSPAYFCYYYPTERMVQLDSGTNFPLPDLVEVDLAYNYSPIPTEISTKTPLGNGFSLIEHARGRLEPNPVPN